MTQRDDIQREIEAGEAWLRGVDELPTLRDVERTKAVLRIELNERWLAGVLKDEPPRYLTDQVKSRTRRELIALQRESAETVAASPIHGKRDAPYHWPRWATVVGLAAAACVAIVPLLSGNASTTGGFAWETAFTAYEEAPLDDPIDSLDSELDELESLMQATRAGDDYAPLESIDGDLYEYFLSDDWWLIEWDDWS